jgi:aminoglycoside phosphotransferase (APT) family kinase protein
MLAQSNWSHVGDAAVPNDSMARLRSEIARKGLLLPSDGKALMGKALMMSRESDLPEMSEQRQTVMRLFRGATVLGYAPMNGGISSGATRWDIELPDATLRRVVVRRPTRDDNQLAQRRAAAEAHVLRLVAGVVKAPTLLAYEPDGPNLVLDYVEGSPVFTPSLSHEIVDQLAQELATIHSFAADSSFCVLPDVGADVRRRLQVDTETLDDALKERQVRLLLGKWVPRFNNARVLLHGDYWPGNVLFQGANLTAVIDWEEAAQGDPLFDLAVARLDSLWAFGVDTMNRFTTEYLSRSRVDGSELPWWDLVAALRPMSNLERWASAYAEPPISRPDITRSTMQRDTLWFIERAAQALGVNL